VLLESAATVLPSTVTHHVGYVRDEKTLEVGNALSSCRGGGGLSSCQLRHSCKLCAASIHYCNVNDDMTC